MIVDDCTVLKKKICLELARTVIFIQMTNLRMTKRVWRDWRYQRSKQNP